MTTRMGRDACRTRNRRIFRQISGHARGGDTAIACPKCGDAGPRRELRQWETVADMEVEREALIGRPCTTRDCDGKVERVNVAEAAERLLE